MISHLTSITRNDLWNSKFLSCGCSIAFILDCMHLLFHRVYCLKWLFSFLWKCPLIWNIFEWIVYEAIVFALLCIIHHSGIVVNSCCDAIHCTCFDWKLESRNLKQKRTITMYQHVDWNINFDADYVIGTFTGLKIYQQEKATTQAGRPVCIHVSVLIQLYWTFCCLL